MLPQRSGRGQDFLSGPGAWGEGRGIWEKERGRKGGQRKKQGKKKVELVEEQRRTG